MAADSDSEPDYSTVTPQIQARNVDAVILGSHGNQQSTAGKRTHERPNAALEAGAVSQETKKEPSDY